MAHSSGVRLRSLFQDFVGHRNFAQIVQIAAAAQGHDGFLVQAEMASQVAGMTRQAFAVAFGVRIAALHAQAQRAQHRFRRLQFIGEFLELEQRLDPGKQLLREKSACAENRRLPIQFPAPGPDDR